MATIRLRQDADLDDCVNVLRAVHADSGYPVDGLSNAAEFIRGHGTMAAWVAELDGCIVGHSLVGEPDRASPAVVLWRDHGLDDSTAVFNRLFVHPAHKGNGIAKLLSAAAVEYGRKHSLRLLLYVLEKDVQARQLYEKLGWIHYGNSMYEYGDGQSMRTYCYASPELCEKEEV